MATKANDQEYLKKQNQQGQQWSQQKNGSGQATPQQQTAFQNAYKSQQAAYTQRQNQQGQQWNQQKNNAYKPSANVTAAQEYLKSVKDGGYNKKWSQTLDSLVNEYMGRGAFEYNADDDVQWQQAKAEGLREANTAMRNSMAQAAALSGGYGNSYAATLGNQVYQQGVVDVMALAPEYYQQAYQRYKDEGDRMLSNIGLAQGLDDTEYARWADEMLRAQSAYDSEYARDYTNFSDQRAYDYQMNRDAVNDERYDQEWAYQQERDAVADSQWQSQFDYQKQRDIESDRKWQEQFDYDKSIDERNFNYQYGRDQVADNQWQQQFDANNSHWQQEFDYSKYADERDFGYRSTQDAIANARWQQEFDADNARWAEEFNYKMDQDRIANDQWRETFDYQKDQDNNSRYITNLENRNDRLESENSSLQDRENARIQQEQDEAKAVEAAATSRAVMNFISNIGSSSSNVGNDIKQAYLDGDFGDGDAAKQKIAYLFVHYGYSEDEANKIMGWN